MVCPTKSNSSRSPGKLPVPPHLTNRKVRASRFLFPPFPQLGWPAANFRSTSSSFPSTSPKSTVPLRCCAGAHIAVASLFRKSLHPAGCEADLTPQSPHLESTSMYAKPNLKYFSAILSIVVAAALAVAPQARQTPAASSDQTTLRTQSKDSSKKAAAAGNTGSEDQQDQDDAANDESDDPDPAPAALQIDVSAEPPLIKELYQATRETKEQAILASLARAKGILTNGADLQAVDRQGRTALHWVIFGCSYSTNPNIQVAYEELADKMIPGGIDINKEDAYQDTALDYLLYSANFEIQTLLLEHGANSGFLAASVQYVKEEAAEEVAEEKLASARTLASTDTLWRGADLTPGQTLSVRLDAPVFSDRSRTGDPITATVTYPLCKGGENIRCKDGELVLPPGTKINGTILFAEKAPDKYTRPRVVLDFSNVLHKSGAKSALYTRVLNMDNARETVRNNEILGIIQPHASKKMSLMFAGL